MSVISSLPAQALLPLSGYEASELRDAAAEAQHVFLWADCAGCTDKDSVLKAIATGLSFGDHFGVNLDALYDCVTDLEADDRATAPGFVILLINLPDSPGFDVIERNRLLDVFRDAAAYFADEGAAFRVFYSVGTGGTSR